MTWVPARSARGWLSQLNLSEDQQNQIKFFLDDQRAQMETLRADGSLTRDQRREQAQQIQEAMRANIQSILSVEQQMQAEQLQRHEAEHMLERRQHEAEHMLERLSQRLELNAAQQETIEAYQQNHFDALRALRDDTTLTREQKREQVAALRQQIEDNIRATLTPEQQAEFDALRQQRGERRRPGRRNRGFRPGGFSGSVG